MSGGVKLRLGTRGSPLAMAQTHKVAAALAEADPALARPDAIRIVVIRTSGDKILNRSLADQGGKGLFVKEIEEALAEGAIDAGVHSAKDVPTHISPRMMLSCVLPRDDARDAFFAREDHTLETLPLGSMVGTASPRRQALVLAMRPDLRVTLLRGNVDTRLRKLDAGEVDATLLAVAGLARLGASDRLRCILDPEIMTPAAGQGAIAIETRADDMATRALLAPVHCQISGDILAAERLVVARLNGSCNSPIAAWGRLKDEHFILDALAAKIDGSIVHRVRREGPANQMHRIASELGGALAAELPQDFFPE